jgi:hypothetical protein
VRYGSHVSSTRADDSEVESGSLVFPHNSDPVPSPWANSRSVFLLIVLLAAALANQMNRSANQSMLCYE